MEGDLREFQRRWCCNHSLSEESLSTNGAIDRALEKLRAQDHVYEKDGALWFRATAFGDEKDRVVVHDVKTYFASDMASISTSASAASTSCWTSWARTTTGYRAGARGPGR